MSFKMRKLTSFSMEKLCYDLKLDMFERMEPNDAIELVKVNAGSRSILLRTPWIVFGHQVHEIRCIDEEIRIEKFPGSSFVKFDADLHLPLIKRIHSSDRLVTGSFHRQFSDQQATIVNQLTSVKHLIIHKRRDKSLLKLLENLHLMIEESAYFDVDVNIDLFKKDQVLSELFKNFIANQMNDCEEVEFDCASRAAFYFSEDVFAKTSVKILKMLNISGHFEEIVQSIVEKGIPSKNLKAAFYANACCSQKMNARIVDFFSQFPGMKRFDGENNQEVIKIANKRLKNQVSYLLGFTDGPFFRRNIDSSRDCVYMLSSHYNEFFAFYVQPQSEMMEF